MALHLCWPTSLNTLIYNSHMAKLTSTTQKVTNFLSSSAPTVLNVGTALLLAAGIALLPVDISFRLIGEGLLGLAVIFALA